MKAEVDGEEMRKSIFDIVSESRFYGTVDL